MGYDSRDLVLDLTAADDLSHWAYKDVDELTWLVEQGGLSRTEAEWIHGQGRRAADVLERRGFPYDADWSRWAPDPAWPTPTPPALWTESPVTSPLRG